MNQHKELLHGNISTTLLKMTNSISIGFISIFTFNLVDTFFISQLGSIQLAAVSFAFPVVFLWMNIFFGLNTGITTQIGKAVGSNNISKARSISINSIIFISILAFLITTLGYLKIDIIFRLLGAEGNLLKYIKQYISIWYLGCILLMVTMASGAAIRGQGDAITPSRILVISGFINGILDPILIFGLGPIPRLEITGAIIATVISWFIACSLSLYKQFTSTAMWQFKTLNQIVKMINKKNINKLRNSFLTDIKNILNISLPAMVSNILGPLSYAIIIKIVALESIAAVAAVGVGMRLESLAIIFVISLSIAIVPFVSLNHGAKNYQRINQGFKYAINYIFKLQFIIYIILFILARYIAELFSNDPEVVNIIVLYLRIIPGAYCFLGFIMIILSALNAIEKAYYSTLINIIRFFILTIPLVLIGRYYYGIMGILVGIALAKILAFLIAINIYKKVSYSF